MTDYQKYINALRKCAKEHKNDITPFAHIRVSDLCKDTANLLEALEQEPAEKNSKTCGTCRYFRERQDKEDIERCRELFGENTLCGYCTYWEDIYEVALPTIEYNYCSHYKEVEE